MYTHSCMLLLLLINIISCHVITCTNARKRVLSYPRSTVLPVQARTYVSTIRTSFPLGIEYRLCITSCITLRLKSTTVCGRMNDTVSHTFIRAMVQHHTPTLHTPSLEPEFYHVGQMRKHVSRLRTRTRFSYIWEEIAKWPSKTSAAAEMVRVRRSCHRVAPKVSGYRKYYVLASQCSDFRP